MITQPWRLTLFDANDAVCFTDTPKGIDVAPLGDQTSASEFVCLNALDPLVDHKPIAHWHASNKPRRADHNVTKLRSFLVEFDKRELVDQIEFIEAVEMPFSLMTFSGSKSIHFVICLETPLSSLEDYAGTAFRIMSALGGKASGVDESTKNPSRLTRTPGATRSSNGVEQALLENRGRVKNEVLEAWLERRGFDKASYDAVQAKRKLAAQELAKARNHGEKYRAILSPKTTNFLMSGAVAGEWNKSFFLAACDMTRCGYTEAEVYDRLERAFGHLEPVTVSTIRSAIRRAEADA